MQTIIKVSNSRHTQYTICIFTPTAHNNGVMVVNGECVGGRVHGVVYLAVRELHFSPSTTISPDLRLLLK